MNNRSKINVKMGWAIVVVACLFILTLQVKAGRLDSSYLFNALINNTDTIPKKKKPLVKPSKPDTSTAKITVTDSLLKAKNDSINTIDTLYISKDSIDAPIKYKASDSGVLIIPTKEFILYGKANVTNKDVVLDAATIQYDQSSHMVRAYGATDTTGNPYSKPNLTQGDLKTISDSILFDMKTFKGLTKNTYLQQGELFINAQVMKKVSKDEYYALRGRFTTCNLDTPHFAIRTRKLKMISNKLAVSGPAAPEFEGVPIPIGIPFGIYPLIQGRHSGILPPAFNVSEDYGLGLEGLGYYKVFNEYLDVVTRANIYSYGGWTLNISPKYQKRYRYNGGLNITFQNTKALNRSYGFGSSFSKEEFTSTKSYSINWQHSQDPRVRPGTNFSASVNFASSRYNKTVLNNPYLNFQNQLSSTVSYSKDFRGKANLSINANHNQNNNTHLVNLGLPNMGFNVNTFYPFQKKESVGTGKWYEKLGIGYSGTFSNQISFYDTAVGFSFKKLLDTAQYSATHSIPISLALPSLGAITLSPGISYSENWFAQKIIQTWNGKKLDTTMTKGLYRVSQLSFSLSASTRIFGTYLFK
ncbi:MAG: LPS-assembly protein LptD, partial [Pedobacter sp.]|nr:LPS-assembly protein LptD [Chitinophagaceae bacterium]